MSLYKLSYESWRSRVLPLMEQTEKRNQHWFAKQVDEALLNGRASLFLVEEGFFVLSPVWTMVKCRYGYCLLGAIEKVRLSAIYRP